VVLVPAEATMRKFFIVAGILLLMSGMANAKMKVRLFIQLDDNAKLKAQLMEGVEARLNSTERYGVVGKEEDSDFLLAVFCMVESAHKGETGFSCVSIIEYFPFPDTGSYIVLYDAGTILGGPLNEGEFVTNGIANKFINGTTDEKLTARKTELLTSIKLLCLRHVDACQITPRSQQP
jgi:hypothetical protein